MNADVHGSGPPEWDQDVDLPDVVELLAEHPEDWVYATVADALAADPAARRVLDDVRRRHRLRVEQDGRRGRRRRWVAGGAAVLVAATGATAAAVTLRGQPERPESGSLCRAEARIGGNAVAIPSGEDAIEGCRQAWQRGDLGSSGGSVPPLTACIGPNGIVEVFPAERGICESLELPAADLVLSAENQAIVELQERLGAALNPGDCHPMDEAIVIAQRIADDSTLEGWTVAVGPGSESADCAVVAVDAVEHTVTLIGLRQ